MAFIGAERRPLTEEAGGSGAGFSQEGHLKGERFETEPTIGFDGLSDSYRVVRIEVKAATAPLIQVRDRARAIKSGKRFNSSSVHESFEGTVLTGVEMHCAKGSNASRSIAAYFFRS